MPAHDAPDDTRRGLKARVTLLLFRVTDRLKLGVAAAYLAAASLIGFEALVALLSITSLWPATIPFVVGTLALVYVLRERIRRWWRRLRSRD